MMDDTTGHDSGNWGIFGHEWAVNLLREHVGQNQQRHAYLLTGPQGIGRRTLALRLAQALNCPQPVAPGEPCRNCRTCVQIMQMQHPDLAVVQSQQDGGVLRVEQIRELQRSLALAPYQARFRVALLLHFEDANDNAANALLKTLEEPAAQVVLILTAQNSESLLPTIVSRCEVLRLRPLPLELTRLGLQTGWGLPPELAESLAHLSGGRLGFAVGLHEHPEWLERRQAWLDDHRRLLVANRVERFAYAEVISKEKDSLRALLLIWLAFWRDILLRSIGSQSPLTNLDRRAEIDDLAAQLGAGSARRYISCLQRTLDLLDRNANTRLAMEVLLLDLPRLR